jgi:hypothetical protein
MSVVPEERPPVVCIASAANRAEVEQVIKLAAGESQDLLTQRAALLRRLATLRRTIAGLAELFGDGIMSRDLQVLIKLPTQRIRQIGLTEACRAVLSESPQPLTARDVVARIQVTLQIQLFVSLC